jgi:hypothetical protein
MIFVFPLGVPLYYALTLYRHKEELTELRHLELSMANEQQRVILGNFLEGAAKKAYEPEIFEAEERTAELQVQFDDRAEKLPGAIKKLTNGYEVCALRVSQSCCAAMRN